MHVSALLHALVALTPDVHCSESDMSSDEEATPCTSILCQWKPARKRKATAQPVSTANFQKHEYGKIKKYSIQSIESFDPRPETMRYTSSTRIPTLLQNVKGKGLCVALLLDTSVSVETPKETTALMKSELLKKVANFKKQLEVSKG